MSIEIEGALELAADWEAAEGQADRELGKVVFKGSMNVKADWRRRWTGHQYAPALGTTVTFDMDADGLGSEIGPDKDIGPGALGNIYEFGIPGQNTPPQPGGLPAIAAEEPRFVTAVEDVAERLASP